MRDVGPVGLFNSRHHPTSFERFFSGTAADRVALSLFSNKVSLLGGGREPLNRSMATYLLGEKSLKRAYLGRPQSQKVTLGNSC